MFSSVFAYSQPTNIQTPVPCKGEFERPWSTQPKWYRICSDTVQNLQGQGLGTCCYWIKYYDRKFTKDDGTKTYQTNVVAIIFEGSDCEKRTQDNIIQEFQEALYQKIANEDPSFYEEFGFPQGWYSTHDYADFYTTGGCFQTDKDGNLKYEGKSLINCDENIYCCKRSKVLNLLRGYEDKIYVTSIDPILPEQTEPLYQVFKVPNGASCPCKSNCENVLMRSTININCDTPCNEGEWKPMEKQIPIPNCPDCFVKAKFSVRTTPPCPQFGNMEANDILLEEIFVDDDPTGPCALCNLPSQDIHQIVFQNLINSEFKNTPTLPNTCKNYFRFFQSSCWHDNYVEGHWENEPVYPYNRIWIKPFRMIFKCAGDNCCKRTFRICTDGTGKLLPPVQIGIAESSSLNCDYSPLPCFFICQ